MRFGSVVVAASIAISACATSKPKAGDVCKIEDEGTIVCSGATTALLCKASRRVERACRGPKGCDGTARAACDTSLGREGDSCDPPPVDGLGGPLVCTEDKGAILVCRNGALAIDMRCRGPKACDPTKHVNEDWKTSCDRTLAEVGDPCNTRSWNTDRLGACSLDKKASLVCDKEEKGKLVVSHVCGGAKGCEVGHLQGDPGIPMPVCDRGAFAPTAACGKDDGDECAPDGVTLLKCKHETAKYEGTRCSGKERCTAENGLISSCHAR